MKTVESEFGIIWKGQRNVQPPPKCRPCFSALQLDLAWGALLNIEPCELENMSVLQKYLAQFLKESSGFFIAQVSIQRFLRQWNRAVFEAKKVSSKSKSKHNQTNAISGERQAEYLESNDELPKCWDSRTLSGQQLPLGRQQLLTWMVSDAGSRRPHWHMRAPPPARD